MNDADALKFRNQRVIYALSVTALCIALGIVGLAVLHFLGRVGTVTTAIVGAVFFSYLVAPSIRALRRRMPAWAAVVIVYLVIAILIAGFLWFAVPLIISDLKQINVDTPSLTRKIQQFLSVNTSIAASLPESVRAYLATVPAQVSDIIGRNSVNISSGALSVIVSAASSLLLFVLIPIVSAYAIMDADWLRGAARGLIPAQARPKAEEFVNNVNAVLAGYIRGQLLVAAAVGALVTVLLLLFKVKYAIAIGLFAGLFELVPYLGAIAGAVPGVGIALITNGWENALFVALGFIAINQISGHVLSPLIVGETIGVRPIFILFALLVGGELLGLRGLLIAVPVAGIIRAIILTFVPFDKSMLPPEPIKRQKPVPEPPKSAVPPPSDAVKPPAPQRPQV